MLINNEWLDREKREKRISLLKELLKEYAKLDPEEITVNEIEQWEGLDKELEDLKRVQRGEQDILYFAYEYFSEERNPDNQDNLITEGQTLEGAAEFHTELCGLLNDVSSNRVDNHVAWSVGRGHAKTAYLSNVFLCHQVVYRLRKYIVEVSETTDVAGDFIQWTANQLKFNEKLIKDFGQLLHKKPSMNKVDNKHEFVTTTDTKVEAKGVQTQMRGLRHGATRPDLFLLDDLESRDNTNTPELRDKNKRWFREEMLPALSQKGIIVFMGTIVHYDSVLNYVIEKRKDFTSRKFPAILKWGEREDLWQIWRDLYREDSPDARERATSFYKQNEKEMLRGTEILWPGYFSYLSLMEIRENDGAKAFNQEYLGNPIDEESQIFNPEEFTYYDEGELEGKKIQKFAAVDLAMGKARGDYSAMVVLARNVETGVAYVVDVYLKRVHPDVFLNEVATLAMKHVLDGLAVEAQHVQEWFAHKLKEELQRRGYPAFTRVKEVKQKTRKELRIEALLPDIQSGKIRFNRKHRLLLEMLELYPNHNHDDGPDALAEAFRLAQGGKKRVIDKPEWL